MATEKLVCNTCKEERDINLFATFFSAARNKEYREKRCRFCKNEAGRKLMAEKAKQKALERAETAEEEPDIASEKEDEPQLSPEEQAKVEKQRQWQRQYYEKNKEAVLARAKKYKEDNKDKINATRRKYLKKKMKDPVERLKRSMKTLLLAKMKKNSSSTTYFGSKIDFIKKWLEFNFEDDMSWDNYGKHWQIDHTIPIDLWNVQDDNDAKLCFNWKNLMPLHKDRNLRKASHLQPSRVFYQEHRVRIFCKQNNLDDGIDEYMHKYATKLKSLLPQFYMRHTSIAGNSC